MGINTENLFVRALDTSEVTQRACAILAETTARPVAIPGWAAPAASARHTPSHRKVAVSPVCENWLQVLTSDEVIEPHLALEISRQLDTDAVAVQVYETAGGSGYTHCRGGGIVSSKWSEDTADPYASVCAALEQLMIRQSVRSFADAAREKGRGWIMTPVVRPGAA